VMAEQLVLEAWQAAKAATPSRRGAVAMVQQALASILPPGVPSPIARVISASLRGGKATASVEYWDGLRGCVQVSRWHPDYADAWTVQWTESGGGMASWNGTAWERVAEVSRWQAD
jgi:hypothetical protein